MHGGTAINEDHMWDIIKYLIRRVNFWIFRDSIIKARVLTHQQNLIGKYDTPEFKALPHMKKFDIMIADSIIPNIYDP
jgi:hypothetical protein